MRIFRGPLPLNNYESRSTRALHARLDDAILASAALQDDPHLPEKEIALEEAVRDLASALLGREIHLGDTQPKTDHQGVINAYLSARNRKAG